MFIQNLTIYYECSHLFICLSLTTIPLRSVSSISQVRNLSMWNLSMCLPAEFQVSSGYFLILLCESALVLQLLFRLVEFSP